jgi:hypothetical protein
MSTRLASLVVSFLALLLATPLTSAGLASSRPAQESMRITSRGPAAEPAEAPAKQPTPPGSQVLRLDDGIVDTVLGVTNEETSNQAVYLNRFSPDPELLPITIDTVSILFPLVDPNGFETGLRPRMTFQLLVYVDEAGTGDPLHSELVRRETFDLAPSNTAFQNITLDMPVEVARGDVYIGFTDFVTSVTNEQIFPAAFDSNQAVNRAYAFHNFDTGSHFDGENLAASDSGPILLPGAWMIRALYTTGGTVQLCWDPGVGDGLPAPTNARLCTPSGGKMELGDTAAQGSLKGFNVYRSTQPNVQTVPGNLFTSTGPNQTTAGSGVTPGGSFFVVTAVFDEGESGPSNEVEAKPPTITALKVKPAKVNATGADFQAGLRIFVDGIPFAAPPKIKRGTKVNQKGALLTGETIGAYLSAHGNKARITFRNADGTATTVDHQR